MQSLATPIKLVQRSKNQIFDNFDKIQAKN